MDLIQTDELLASLHVSPLSLLDCSYFTDVDCRAKHYECRIPTAKFFDIKSVRDTTVTHPMKVPTVEQFATEMRKLRLKNDGSLIVLYDQTGMFGVGRAWWLLRYFGYLGPIKVLWGGLPRWVEEGKPTETGEYQLEGTDETEDGYKFPVNPFMLVTIDQLKAALPAIQSGASQVQLWDTRVDKLYAEGAIPGHTHIVFRQLLDEKWTFKSKDEIRAILTAQGLDLRRPVVTMCRSGVVAAISYLILKYVGKEDVAMYAGSWLEWAAQQ